MRRTLECTQEKCLGIVIWAVQPERRPILALLPVLATQLFLQVSDPFWPVGGLLWGNPVQKSISGVWTGATLRPYPTSKPGYVRPQKPNEFSIRMLESEAQYVQSGNPGVSAK